jgi:hypothetical protein
MEPLLDERIKDERVERLKRTLRALRFSESLALGFLMMGFLFKVQHWPASGLILIAATVTLFTASVIRIFLPTDKWISVVKLAAAGVMVSGPFLGYFRVPNAGTISIIAVILYLSFHFYGYKETGK